MNEETTKIYDTLKRSLSETKRQNALLLLEKAILKTQKDKEYLALFSNTLRNYDTLKGRVLFADWGNYAGEEYPYSHSNAVDSIDTALGHILWDTVEEGIELYNHLHN